MSLSAKRLTGPSWSCVHFSAEQPDAAELEAAGIKLVEIDARDAEDGDGLIEALAAAFAFPDYFGRNWDAVDECLRDLSWLPGKGYVLVVGAAERLWSRNPRPAGKLVRSWLFCAESWSRQGIGFHLVFVW